MAHAAARRKSSRRRAAVLLLTASVLSLSAVSIALMYTCAEKHRRFAVDPLRIQERSLWQQMRADGDQRPEIWVHKLGVTKETFEFIVNEVRPRMRFRTRHNRLRQRSVEERVMCALYKLHTGCTDEECDTATNIPKASVRVYLRAFVDALYERRTRWIYLPGPQELANIADAFEEYRGLPNCVGAIDGTHLPINTSEQAYHNHKGYKSIVAQAIVDHRCLIRDFYVGCPGSWSDLVVLNDSDVRDWIRALPQLAVRSFGGVNIGYYLVGDGIYTLRNAMFTPFDGHGLDPWQRDWNYVQSATRMVVERTFGILKGRWRILCRPASLTMRGRNALNRTSKIAMACAVLHNICMVRGETIDDCDIIDHTAGCYWEGRAHAAVAEPPNALDEARRKRKKLMLHAYANGA